MYAAGTVLVRLLLLEPLLFKLPPAVVLIVLARKVDEIVKLLRVDKVHTTADGVLFLILDDEDGDNAIRLGVSWKGKWVSSHMLFLCMSTGAHLKLL